MEKHLKRKARRLKQGFTVKTADMLQSRKKGFGYEMPPDRRSVEIYFDQKGFAQLAAAFFECYDQADWRSPKGTRYRNWKLLAGDWIFDVQQQRHLESSSLLKARLRNSF